MADLDIAALRDRITNYRAVKWPSMSLPIDDVKTLLDAAEERDRLLEDIDAAVNEAERWSPSSTDLHGEVRKLVNELHDVHAQRDAILTAAQSVTAEGHCDGGDVVQILKAPWARLGELCVQMEGDGLGTVWREDRLRAQRDALLDLVRESMDLIDCAESSGEAFDVLSECWRAAADEAIAAAKETP